MKLSCHRDSTYIVAIHLADRAEGVIGPTTQYGLHEVKTLILTFTPQLYQNKLVRRTKNLFGIWHCGICKNKRCTYWSDLVDNLPFGKLTWDTSIPSNNLIFLDMVVSKKSQRQKLEPMYILTYQKSMNLYLYLTPTSNHHFKLY